MAAEYPPNDCFNVSYVSGYLGGDPVVSYTANGMAIAKFSIGSSYNKKVDGSYEKFTDWINCVCFNYKAEAMANAHKGDFCVVSGKISTSTYEDPTTGEKKYHTSLLCNTANVRAKHTPAKKIENSISSNVAKTQEEEDEIPF